mgnify:CR=1 FL=1
MNNIYVAIFVGTYKHIEEYYIPLREPVFISPLIKTLNFNDNRKLSTYLLPHT